MSQIAADFSGVFLGAFLAFLGGIALNELVTRSRQKANRRLARDIIAIELVHNLEVLDSMSLLAKQTMDEGFMAVHTPMAAIRASILQPLLASNWLEGMPAKERRHLLNVVATLQRAEVEYEAWQRALSPERGLATIIAADGGRRMTYRELKTEQLQETLGLVQIGLLDLLIYVCNSADDQTFTDDEVQKIRKKLEPTRVNWPKSPTFGRWYASSGAKKAPPDRLAKLTEAYKFLVVWTHDWPECPIQVIELRTRAPEQGFVPA